MTWTLETVAVDMWSVVYDYISLTCNIRRILPVGWLEENAWQGRLSLMGFRCCKNFVETHDDFGDTIYWPEAGRGTPEAEHK